MTAAEKQSSGSAFWRFSLRFYRQPQVADACIALQEEAGVDVNLLLFLLWHATREREFSAAEVAELERDVGAWREMTVVPLAHDAPGAEIAAGLWWRRQAAELFRTRIKAVELEAERLQQEAMYELARAALLGRQARSRSRRRAPMWPPTRRYAGRRFRSPRWKPCSRPSPASSASRRMTMDKDTYDRGLAMRRKVLGDEYVDRALASADDFNRDFQRFVTQYCWGEAWGDDTLTPRERSILNLGMIASLGKMEEFQTHVRGALRNGLTPDEIRAVLTQIAIYCGVPVGVDCFRIAKAVLNEGKKT